LDKNPKTKAEAAKLNDIERFMKSGKLPIEKETVLGYEKNIKAQEREYKKLLDAPAAAPGTPPATGTTTPAPASGSTNVAPPRVRN